MIHEERWQYFTYYKANRSDRFKKNDRNFIERKQDSISFNNSIMKRRFEQNSHFSTSFNK